MTTRSEFLKRSVKLVSGALATALDSKILEEIRAIPISIFPPGAVSDFTSVCTACGDCLPVCPEQAIKIEIDELSGKLLPRIQPSKAACTMCQDTPCISACKIGALIEDQNQTFPEIGLAIVNKTTCMAHNGNACLVCYDACPMKRSALKMKLNRPVIDSDICTGCGVCEYVCIIEGEKGIKIEAL
ncbi:MAG: 4Fe-4S binding protein [candidate division Zixibacteria bacterium]|nr:4Fe-4S binding protein [candidate division Zixibacteria bacterium]